MARLPGLARLLGFFRFLAGEAGSVAPMMALMLLPLAGTIAIAVEQGEWFYLQRSTQNAADAAALAAATNNSTTGSTYQNEAAAAAAKFNYVDGSNHATVLTQGPNDGITCPPGSTGVTCYKTTITQWVPLSFSQVVGFAGSTQCQHCQLIQSSAIANADAVSTTTTPCVWTLSSSSTSFSTSGAPAANLGCSLYSAGGASCAGGGAHDLGAPYGLAVGINESNKPCGAIPVSGAPVVAAPGASYSTNIPTPSCPTGYHHEADSTFATSGNVIPAGTSISSNTQYCGDIKLAGDVTLTGSLIINNGQLDTNGHTVSTAAGGGTIIFSGTNTAGYTEYPTGGGTLNIQAPTSGTWSGVAIYQNPILPNANVSFTFAGNSPTWNLTGLVYLPNADVTIKGAVGKNANGTSCRVLVTNTLVVKGTADFLIDVTTCAAAGLTVPGVAVAYRAKLVQ